MPGAHPSEFLTYGRPARSQGRKAMDHEAVAGRASRRVAVVGRAGIGPIPRIAVGPTRIPTIDIDHIRNAVDGASRRHHRRHDRGGSFIPTGAAPFTYTGTQKSVLVIQTTTGAILNVSYSSPRNFKEGIMAARPLCAVSEGRGAKKRWAVLSARLVSYWPIVATKDSTTDAEGEGTVGA
jgi:hypothetical protein